MLLDNETLVWEDLEKETFVAILNDFENLYLGFEVDQGYDSLLLLLFLEFDIELVSLLS